VYVIKNEYCILHHVTVLSSSRYFLYYLLVGHKSRVATNLENLEYSGISLNVENSRNSVQHQGKIVTNKVFLVRHSNICVKQLLAG